MSYPPEMQAVIDSHQADSSEFQAALEAYGALAPVLLGKLICDMHRGHVEWAVSKQEWKALPLIRTASECCTMCARLVNAN